MNDELWNNFIHTGSVTDYLKYKRYEEKTKAEMSNANNNEGLDNQRANYWGE